LCARCIKRVKRMRAQVEHERASRLATRYSNLASPYPYVERQLSDDLTVPYGSSAAPGMFSERTLAGISAGGGCNGPQSATTGHSQTTASP